MTKEARFDFTFWEEEKASKVRSGSRLKWCRNRGCSQPFWAELKYTGTKQKCIGTPAEVYGTLDPFSSEVTGKPESVFLGTHPLCSGDGSLTRGFSSPLLKGRGLGAGFGIPCSHPKC